MMVSRVQNAAPKLSWSRLYPALKVSRGDQKIQVCLKDAFTHEWELTMHIVRITLYSSTEVAITAIPNVANTSEGFEKFQTTGLSLASDHRLKTSPIRMGSFLGAPGLCDAVRTEDLTNFALSHNSMGALVTFKDIPIFGINKMGLVLPWTRVGAVSDGIPYNGIRGSVILPEEPTSDVIPCSGQNPI